MFGKVLVTATLLDSFEFAVNAPPNWRQTAERGFVAKVKRESVDYPSWVQAGMDFEDAVYKVCNRADNLEQALEPGSEEFKKVVSLCYGGTFQNKLSKDFTIGSNKAYFFGYTDVDKAKMTMDIKTCLKWKGQSKYLNKIQHKLYLWMNDKEYFEYIVVQWKNGKDATDGIRAPHTVPFHSPGKDVLEGEIVRRTQAMWDYIHESGLWEDYYFTFSKN